MRRARVRSRSRSPQVRRFLAAQQRGRVGRRNGSREHTARRAAFDGARVSFLALLAGGALSTRTGSTLARLLPGTLLASALTSPALSKTFPSATLGSLTRVVLLAALPRAHPTRRGRGGLADIGFVARGVGDGGGLLAPAPRAPRGGRPHTSIRFHSSRTSVPQRVIDPAPIVTHTPPSGVKDAARRAASCMSST